MKRYLLKRILFSLFALIVVVGIVMVLVYSLIDRSLIFVGDPMVTKKANNELEIYHLQQWQKYGYLRYTDYSSFVYNEFVKEKGDDFDREDVEYTTALSAIKDPNTYLENNYVKEFYEKFKKDNYTVEYMAPKYKTVYEKDPETGKRVEKKSILSQPFLIAKKDINVFVRLFNYFTGIVDVETINDVKDEKLTDRYIRWEWDKRSNMPALVGSGTRHKYLLYFDDKFPFVHQNLIHFNLGKSYVVYRDMDITEVFDQPSGGTHQTLQEYPTQLGTGNKEMTAYDYHTVTYNGAEKSDIEIAMYGDDPYTNASMQKEGLSRMQNSFVIGIVATLFVYLLGLPLGILMALKKDKLPDKIGNLYIVFIIAVPSLAYIFMLAGIGMFVFGLPYKYATASVKFFAYIMPTVSLALPAIGGLMKWMRRYMIDQMNSDYVKFARSQGLSEGEIFSKHISPNAMIFLVHGIPADILGALVGAIITERVYGIPGVGGLLTNAINDHDNGVIVAMALFYTTLTIIALIAGDLLLAKYDPRISFTEGGN